MKLICTQSELSTHLSLVSRAVPSRPSHPVLANVLLNADATAQRVSLTGFDLSLGVQTSFPAQVEEGGMITLPAKLLSDIVSRLPEGEITLEESDGEALATLTCATGRYQMRGMGAQDYPELPTIEGDDVVYLPTEALIDGLKGSLFAASVDETKQVLTGVHLSVEPETMEFAATDGHRLSVVQTINAQSQDAPEPAPEVKSSKKEKEVVMAGKALREVLEDVPPETAPNTSDRHNSGAIGIAPRKQNTTTEFDVTVPGKALRELERMLQMQQAESVAVRFDQGQLIFEWANQRLTSRLLEGQYPNYRQLIPRQFSRQMTVDRRLFTSGLERIAVLADQRNSIIKFSIDQGKQELVLSVEAQDVGNGREAIAAQVSGEDLDIAFNVKYLLEGLKAITTDMVQMQFNTATSPAILTPLGELKMTYLVMPVQIRS